MAATGWDTSPGALLQEINNRDAHTTLMNRIKKRNMARRITERATEIKKTNRPSRN